METLIIDKCMGGMFVDIATNSENRTLPSTGDQSSHRKPLDPIDPLALVQTYWSEGSDGEVLRQAAITQPFL